ncbi:protein Mis18-beta [Archocentrus centrarchus]|uniref:protein Mis18-beta n=1 Tax=Archocentrus centrarchus TaxID=63155 RepID=UPI0011EA00A6|nr:protein Mis18-beta [Archocentrus centrarchus]
MEFKDNLLIKRTDDVKLLSTAAVRRQQLTLHCQQCSAILADSTGVCGEMKSIDAIMCIRVTSDVVISDKTESGHKGELSNCIYNSLKCSGCHNALGKVIHSAPSHLAVIRSIFLLCKANINCYILNSSSMVKASTLTFDLEPLGESMNEVKKQFQAQLDQMSRMKSRLTDSSVTSKSVNVHSTSS